MATIHHETMVRWRAFQVRQGVPPTGIPDLATLEAVEAVEARSTTRPTYGRFRLGARSLARVGWTALLQPVSPLVSIHPDLFAVLQLAIRLSPHDFGITRTGGVRTLETQAELRARGASRTRNSRHLTGHAVDIALVGPDPFAVREILHVHDAFAEAADRLAVPLRWGGDWDEDGDTSDEKFRDLGHHELPAKNYGNGRHSRSVAAANFLAELRESAAE